MPKNNRSKKSRRTRINRTRKSRYGYFPTGSIVSYQQEPYSATRLVSINEALSNSNVVPKFNI